MPNATALPAPLPEATNAPTATTSAPKLSAGQKMEFSGWLGLFVMLVFVV
jgi:hypothetical protein